MSEGSGLNEFISEDDDMFALVDFVMHVDRLKHVRRRNPTANGARRERTAEHSWHVAMAAIVFAEHAVEPIDVAHCVLLAVVHDLPEVIVGDTFVYGPFETTRQQRELRAMTTLASSLPAGRAEVVHDSWEEYEFKKTADGRYVMALDVLLPVFMNLAAKEKSSWAEHRVTASAVRARIRSVREYLPRLAALAESAVEAAVKDGLLT